MKVLVAICRCLVVLAALCLPVEAQIPSGYVNTTGTYLPLAGGSLSASWTNLSSSPQLALLGCQSTFQTTVSSQIDSSGHFAVLLADTAQICPTPSTWSFVLTCGPGAYGSYPLAVAVTGGGGTEDISSQIAAALPVNACTGSGGGGAYVSTTQKTPQTIVSALNTLPAVGTAGYVCADGYSGVTSNNTFQCIQSSSQGGVAGYAHYGSAQVDQYALTGGTYSYNGCPGWDASFPYVATQCVSYLGNNYSAGSSVQGTPPPSSPWNLLAATGSKSTYAGLVVAETSLTDTINFGIDVPMQNYGTGETIGLNIPMYLPAGYAGNGSEQNEAVRVEADQVDPNTPIESLITGTVASSAGATAVGAQGTNCIVTGFPNGSATEAYVGLSATNTISANTPLTFLNYGGSCTTSVCATGSPVTLNLSNGYNSTLSTTTSQGGAAVCSGTITANLTASKGGVYTGTLGTVSGTTVPVTGTYNTKTLGTGRFIRDFSNELDCNYSWTTSVNSGTFPAFVTQQIAVTGTGCTGTLPWNATNPHTQWNCPAIGGLAAGNPACTGQITQTNAVACFDGGASGGLDACVPVTNFSGGVLTVNLFADFNSASTPWPTNWSKTGIVRLYGAAYPTAVTTAGPGLPVTAFTSADVTGLGTGHTVDQVQAYNSAEQDIHSVAAMPMGIAGHGDGAFLSNFSPVNSPAKQAAVRTGGLYNYGVYVDGYSQNALQKTQLASFAIGQHSVNNVIVQDNTLAAQWTNQVCFFQIMTFSDAISHCPITIDPVNRFLGINDNQTIFSLTGNISTNGWLVSEFSGTGPYSGNLIHYSEFQGATCTTNWTLTGTTSGASCTNGQPGDVFNGSNAALVQTAALTVNNYTALDAATITASSAGNLPYYFGVTAWLKAGQLGTVAIANNVVTGTGTATLTLFNNGNTGGNVVVTVAAGVPTGYSYVNTGSGATSAPTSASCGSTTGSASCSAGTVTVSTTLLTQSSLTLALHTGSTDPCAAQELQGAFFPSSGWQITTTPQLYAGYCIPTAGETLTPIIASFGSGVQVMLSQASVCQSQTGCNPQLITTSAAIPAGFGCISLGIFCPTVNTGTAYDVATYGVSGALGGTPASDLDATSTILTNTPVQRTYNFMGDSQTYSQGGNCTAGGTGGNCWMPVLTAAKGALFGKNIAVSGNTWSDQLKTMFQNNSNSPYTGGPMLYQPNTTVYAGLGQNDANRMSSLYIAYPTNPTAGDTLVVNGSTVTWEASGASGANQVNVGASNAASVTNLLAVLCPTGVVYTGSTPSCGSADSNIAKSLFTVDVGTSGGANIIRVQPALSCTSPPCTTTAQTLSQTGSGVAVLTTTLPTAAQIQSSVLNQAEFAAVAQTAIPAASANGGLASFISAQAMTNSGCTAVNSSPWGYTSNYYAMNCPAGDSLSFTMTGSAFYVGYQGGTVSSGTFNVSVASGSGTYTLGNTTTNCIYGYSSAQITGCLARVATPGANGSAQVTLSVSAGSVVFIFGASNGNAVGTLDQSDFRLWEVFDATNNLDSVYDAERQGERQAMYTLGKLDGMPVQDIPEGQAFNCQLNFALCGGAGQHQALTAVTAFIAPMLGETSGVVYQPAVQAQGTGEQYPVGTISAVNPGLGLSGGGSSGSVTLSAASLCKLTVPNFNTGSTSLNLVTTCTIAAGTLGTNSTLRLDGWVGTWGPLLTVASISGGGGFSGSGTVFLTNFGGCNGSTATVTLSAGAYSSAVVTAAGDCIAAPTTALCTSGTATCTGSPVNVTITSTYTANSGTCTPKVYWSSSSGGSVQSGGALIPGSAITAAHPTEITGSISNSNSLSFQQLDGKQYGTTVSALGPPTTAYINTANASYLLFYMQNSVSADVCAWDQYTVKAAN